MFMKLSIVLNSSKLRKQELMKQMLVSVLEWRIMMSPYKKYFLRHRDMDGCPDMNCDQVDMDKVHDLQLFLEKIAPTRLREDHLSFH